ncbi:MAG: MFS transporter [Alphaproteobacteria bacterium]|nr:MAG: MFS transporter [Alphaproteobacteria bacterium]
MAAPPLLSVSSIIGSMTMNAIGSGIIFAYVPYALTRDEYAPWVAGSMVTAVAGGGIAGCLIAGPLIRRVGHARIFACFVALVIISAWLIALGVHPVAWIASRALYGVAMNGMFIVAQSWINDAAQNEWRGRAMAFFYMAYVIGWGSGAFLFGQIPAEANLPPLITILFAALGILPVGLTRLPNPPPPERVTIDIAKAWRTSPVGMVGVMAAGGLSMLVQGFTPIYAAQNGYGQREVATLLFVMQLGMLGVQYPLGALSDRIDRRLVLIFACLIIAGMASVAQAAGLGSFLTVALVFAIWAGATETIYSVSNAHANDRAGPGDYVPLASAMLIAWSVAAFIFPLTVTAATPVLGPKAFMYFVIALALAYAAFTALRLRAVQPVPAVETENFEIMTAQVPNVTALVNPEAAEGGTGGSPASHAPTASQATQNPACPPAKNG